MYRVISILFCQLFIFGFTFAQVEYETAYSNYSQADSIISARGDFEQAKNLLIKSRITFEELDSTSMVHLTDLLLVKIVYLKREFQACFDMSEELMNRLNAPQYDTLKTYLNYYRGYSYHLLYQFDKANAEFLTATDPTRTQLNDSNFTIRMNWMLAITYEKMQRADEELRTYEKTVDLLDDLDESRFKIRSTVSILGNLGRTHSRLGNTELSLLSLQRALSLIQEYPEFCDTAMEAQNLNAFGSTYLRLGNYNKSIEYLQKSLALKDQVDSWNSLAINYKHQRKFDKAIPIYERLLKKKLTEEYKAIVYNNLGSAHLALKHYPEATKFVKEGLKVNRKTKRKIGLLVSLELLGIIYYETDLYKLAEKHFAEARSQFKTQSSELLMFSSQNFWAMKDTTNALYFGEKAVYKTDSSLYFYSISSPSVSEMFQGQLWLIQLYDMLAINENQFRDKTVQISNLSHEFLLKFREAYLGPTLELTTNSLFLYEAAIKNLDLLASDSNQIEMREDAFTFSEWSKVQALGGERRIKDAKQGFNLPQELVEKEDFLKSRESILKSQIEQYSNGDSIKLAYFKKKLFVNENSQDSLLNIFRTNYPRYYQLRYKNETLNVKDVQQKLNSNQAFIEYFQGDSSSFVFLITSSQYKMVPIELHTDSLILELRNDFKDEIIKQSLPAFAKKSHAVYQAYLEPVVSLLGEQITELIVVPDGNLSYIPFDILVSEPFNNQETKELPYLLNDYQVHYTYAASLYFNDFSNLSSNNEYLAFAPKYENLNSDSTSSTRLGNFRSQITALKHNTDEVNYIASKFKGRGFLNETAHERNFKEYVKEYGLLHLAMHAIIDDEDPMNSKLVFTDTRDSLEDDVLHAFEIYNMEIPSQLTVLSSCETGFGAMAKGEGALSLARAFSYAGSPSIVMSHWPVDDQTTAELMRFFYDHLAQGKTKSEALRQSKLDFLNTTHSARVHPFFWGSFVVLGDDTPIKINAIPLVHPLWILLISLMAIISIGYVTMRRRLYIKG